MNLQIIDFLNFVSRSILSLSSSNAHSVLHLSMKQLAGETIPQLRRRLDKLLQIQQRRRLRSKEK